MRIRRRRCLSVTLRKSGSVTPGAGAVQLGWRTTGLSYYRCRTICHALARS